jgi:hypothetical protein
MLNLMPRPERTRRRRSAFACFILIALALVLSSVEACAGKNAAPNAPQPTAAPQAVAPTEAPSSSANSTESGAQIPQACALLTVADVEKLTGYTGGAATPLDLGGGASRCTIITGKGALTVEVDASPGAFPPLPGEKQVNLEGGAIGKVSTQSGIDQDWMTKIDFTNYNVLLVLGGSAAKIDPDKKIADITKADGGNLTFGQAYEALAHAIAHNAASGAQNPSGVAQLGDPCTALTLDDVKQLVPDFDVTGPDYQDTTFGVKQCIYHFRSTALQAAGFASLAFITQPQFEADMKSRDPLSGIGDAAGATDGMLLDFKKGSTFVYMTFGATSSDANSVQKIQTLMTDGLKQLAHKAAARVGQ